MTATSDTARLAAELEILNARLGACRETVVHLRSELRDVLNDVRRVAEAIDQLDLP